MERITLNATPRENGKGVAHRLRTSGKVPAVLYGRHEAPKSLSLDAAALAKAMKSTSGRSVLFDVAVENDRAYPALLKDYQVHPVRRNYLHLDFQAVDLNETIDVEVPLHFEGQAIGVKEGGILEISRRSLLVRCLPTAIPNFIAVDIGPLAVGQNVHANDLTLPTGVTFPHTENISIVQVVAPQKEEVAAPTAAAAAPAEVPATAQKAPEAAPATKEAAK